MRMIVKKWGNSAALRIPAALMNAAGLHLDETVDMREEGGCIVIESVRTTAFDLDQMVASITPDNLHAAIDFGAPVGKEAF